MNEHIAVAKNGTRTTHSPEDCPMDRRYGRYRGRRESLSGMMSDKTPVDSFVDNKGKEHFRAGVRR